MFTTAGVAEDTGMVRLCASKVVVGDGVSST